MKQILQNLKTGTTEVAEVPCPHAETGQILVGTHRSLISAGTERMLVEFGKAGWLEKARQQPGKVRQVLEKMKTDGLVATAEAVQRKLDEPLPLGYSNVGIVKEVGDRVQEFSIGDRVVSNGPHAEYVNVPVNLAARVPVSVSDEEAVFTVLGSIALQGLRLVQPTVGEQVVVYGLGLIGLLTIQIVRAAGCEVIAIDLAPERLALGEHFGAKVVDVSSGRAPVKQVMALTKGIGADAVLITASAKNDHIVHHAAEMSRKRGRIVLVGVVNLDLRREDFYEKELSFQVSCSYGPGRYDPTYELKGRDYPIQHVRWTVQRNFEAILQLMADRQVQVSELVTHSFPFAQAQMAYKTLLKDPKTLGVILKYSETPKQVAASTIELAVPERKPRSAVPVVALVGAGNYARAVLLPALRGSEVRLGWVVDSKGLVSGSLGRKYGADRATTLFREVLTDDEVSAVLIATRHDSHARMAIEALKAGKEVFLEKPLALNEEEISALLDTVRRTSYHVTVGFNRRFSPHTQKVKELLKSRTEPLAVSMTINAGAIPLEHWVHDPEAGGGRIIGEACHFIDLIVYLAGARIRRVSAVMIGGGAVVRNDKMNIQLELEDGSIGTINYLANGSKAYPKEIIEVFSEGRIATIENFRLTRGYGFSGFRRFRTFRQDKGHKAEMAAFSKWLRIGGAPIIPLEDAVNVTLASFASMRSAGEHRKVDIVEEFAHILSGIGEITRTKPMEDS